jgi:hypothetical protein
MHGGVKKTQMITVPSHPEDEKEVKKE